MSVDPKLPPTSAKLPEGTRIGAVVSRYHAELCGWMLASAKAELIGAGMLESDFVLATAPGAFELPFLAQTLAQRADIDAVLCFGLVLKGETDHDRYISQATANGIMEASLRLSTPILFGVLTCSTLEQATARARPTADGGELDKGREVARAAIETLLSAIDIRKTAP